MIGVVVSRVRAHTHKVLSSLSENGEGAVVLIIRAASLKKNLLRDYVVANKHRSIDTGVFRAMSSVQASGESSVSIRHC